MLCQIETGLYTSKSAKVRSNTFLYTKKDVTSILMPLFSYDING